MSFFNNSFVTGELPNSWSALTNLLYLDFRETDVHGTLPASWSALTNLKYLDVGVTSVHGTLPASWSALTNLTVLDVRSNHLKGSIPESYNSMSKLQRAYLWRNAFCGCLPSAWRAQNATVSVIADDAVTGADCATANNCTQFSSPSDSSSDASCGQRGCFDFCYASAPFTSRRRRGAQRR